MDVHNSHVEHVSCADRQDAGVSAGWAAGAAGGRSGQAAHCIRPHHPGGLQVTRQTHPPSAQTCPFITMDTRTLMMHRVHIWMSFCMNGLAF